MQKYGAKCSEQLFVLQEDMKDATKFAGKKSKAVAKSGSATTQWGILLKSDIPENEIAAFRYGGGEICDAGLPLLPLLIAVFVGLAQ